MHVVVNFILRMAAHFDDRREQLMFLINNYDLMLSVFTERAAFTATDEFQKQLDVCMHACVCVRRMLHVLYACISLFWCPHTILDLLNTYSRTRSSLQRSNYSRNLVEL